MNICEKYNCCGCEVCTNVCSQKAVTMVKGYHGFLYPVINEKLCIECDVCVKKCPTNNRPNGNTEHTVYAALVINDDERHKCTSGGLFTCLAKNIIKNGGAVYGVALDNMVVRHIEATDQNGLDRIRGSKYVQSTVNTCYQKVLNRLNEGRKVLFSGTPCQIAGLKNYLGKDYPSLITVDLLCHGVPSPGVFENYITAEEQKAGRKITDIKFRSKKIGWKKNLTIRYFEDGTCVPWPDSFVPGFLSEYYLRESCYQCQFANSIRQGDITLGDFWGYQENWPDCIEDDDKGISLVILNTKKGSEFFQSIHSDIAFVERSFEEATWGNDILLHPTVKPNDYDDFWDDYSKLNWYDLCEKYSFEQNETDDMETKKRKYYSIPYKRRHFIHKTKRLIYRIVKGILRR